MSDLIIEFSQLDKQNERSQKRGSGKVQNCTCSILIGMMLAFVIFFIFYSNGCQMIQHGSRALSDKQGPKEGEKGVTSNAGKAYDVEKGKLDVVVTGNTTMELVRKANPDEIKGQMKDQHGPGTFWLVKLSTPGNDIVRQAFQKIHFKEKV